MRLMNKQKTALSLVIGTLTLKQTSIIKKLPEYIITPRLDL